MRMKMNKMSLVAAAAMAVVVCGTACALAAPQPLLDPAASADGRFWRDVDGVRWRAVEIPAGATSFELTMDKRYLPEFEEAELLVDVRIGEGVSLKSGTLQVRTSPAMLASYTQGAAVAFDVPGASALKPGKATLRIPLDCRVLPRDGNPAFPACLDAIKFTCASTRRGSSRNFRSGTATSSSATSATPRRTTRTSRSSTRPAPRATGSLSTRCATRRTAS